jgi:UDP-glucose 4-epimerase
MVGTPYERATRIGAVSNGPDLIAMSYRGLNVLVTGADGFIGSHLAEALVREGARVTSLALYTGQDRYGWLDDIAPDTRTGMKIVRGDVRDPAMMQRLVAGQDMVFHLAALIAIPHSYEAPFSYIDVNVTGTANVLEAARVHGTKRVVHTSTSEVYGTAQTVPIAETHPLVAQSPYAASKIAADKLAESYALSFDLPVVILRPFNTYGARQSERAVISSTIRQALDAKCDAIRVGDLTPVRDFNYVGDTISAFLDVGSAQKIDHGRAYNAGSGRGVTVRETVDMIRELTGTNKPVQSEAARVRPNKSEVRELICDSRLLHAATGWTPKTALRDGLAKTIGWWRDRLARGLARQDANYIR